jgi:hypothetical protein
LFIGFQDRHDAWDDKLTTPLISQPIELQLLLLNEGL